MFQNFTQRYLAVNGIWRDGTTPLIVEKFVKKMVNAIKWLFASVIKILLDSIKTNFKTLSALGPVTWPLLEGWYTRNPWFSRYFDNILANVWYFFMKSILVARSYWVLMINIKSLIMVALVTLEMRLKVQILAFFDYLGHFSSCLF